MHKMEPLNIRKYECEKTHAVLKKLMENGKEI